MVIPLANGFEVRLVGYDVMLCEVDYAFTLELRSEVRQVAIRIGGHFVYSRSGATWHLDPDAHPEELGPALLLSRTRVVSAAVDLDGALELTFEDGSQIRVPPDINYEAWSLTTTNGPLIVSGPGGKITYFDAPEGAL